MRVSDSNAEIIIILMMEPGDYQDETNTKKVLAYAN